VARLPHGSVGFECERVCIGQDRAGFDPTARDQFKNFGRALGVGGPRAEGGRSRLSYWVGQRITSAPINGRP